MDCWLGGEGLLACGLVGHLGPQECGELAGQGDGHDGRALALLGEVLVSVKGPELRLPRPVCGLRSGLGPAWRVAVVPGGFDEEAAGVPVAALGDVPTMLLLAGGVLAGGDPEPGSQLSGMGEASEVADLGD